MFLFSSFLNQLPLRRKTHLKIFGLLGFHWLMYKALSLSSIAFWGSLGRIVKIFSIFKSIPPIFLLFLLIFGFKFLRVMILEEPQPRKKMLYFLCSVPAFCLLTPVVPPLPQMPLRYWTNALVDSSTIYSLVLMLALYLFAWIHQYQAHMSRIFSQRMDSRLIEFFIFQALIFSFIGWLLLIPPMGQNAYYWCQIVRMIAAFFLFNAFKLFHSSLYLEPWPHALNLLIPMYYMVWSF